VGGRLPSVRRDIPRAVAQRAVRRSLPARTGAQESAYVLTERRGVIVQPVVLTDAEART
jgi:hypothetical protein